MNSSETNSSDFYEPGSAFPHPIGELLGFNGQPNTLSLLKDAINAGSRLKNTQSS